MKKSILIFGAGGFIGRNVLTSLARAEWCNPIAGVRRASGLTSEFQPRIVSATSVESVVASLEGVDAVVNCVAGDADTIVSGAKALIEAATRQKSPPRVIHLSSMSVYGSVEGSVAESARLQGDLGPYSAAKVAAEAVIAAYPRAVIFRPGCVFGPESDQWATRIARLLDAHRLGDLGAAGDGCCNLVDVADVVLAIVQALQNPQADGRVFNLAIANAPSWNEFLIRYALALKATPVSRISGRRMRIETKLLAPPLKVIEILARKSGLNLQLPPPLPPSLLRLMAQDIRLDCRAAESALKITWKNLDESLSETAQWYRTGQSHAH
jgi:nucleoside-diphosphate-sugar epimerase